MNYFFEITVCTAIFYMLHHALYRNKNSHRFNRFYLLTALSLSVVLPALHLPVFTRYVRIRNVSQEVANQLNTIKEISFFTQPENIIFLLWVFGFLLLLTRFLLRLAAIKKIVDAGEIEPQADYKIVYAKDRIPVSSFMNFLFIPEEKRNRITVFEIRHEAAHIRQKHSLDLIFTELYQAVFWFNPLLILYRRRLREVHEYLADQTSISAFGKQKYTDFLIDQISAQNQPHLLHNFSSLFKKRIDMIDNNLNLKINRILAIVPVLAFTFLTFSCEEKIVPIEPAATVEKTGERVDTVIVFDPETGEETVTVVKMRNENPQTNNQNKAMRGDTIITFDPETGKESMEVVLTNGVNVKSEPVTKEKVKVYDPETGKEVVQYYIEQEERYVRENTGIDTIITFDPETLEETMTIVNRKTGKVIEQE